MATNPLASTFLDAIKNRRTIYTLGNKEIVPDADVVKTIKEVIRESPSSFNSQTSRAVILVGKEHEHYWNDVVATAVKKAVPEDIFKYLNQRQQANAAGRITVLFFESQATVADWQEKRASVRDIFPEWSQQATGIAQINTWTAVSALGLGANLQHHAPMFMKEEINAMYGLPKDWRVYAELAIGSKGGEPREKEYMSDEDRFVVKGL